MLGFLRLSTVLIKRSKLTKARSLLSLADVNLFKQTKNRENRLTQAHKVHALGLFLAVDVAG